MTTKAVKTCCVDGCKSTNLPLHKFPHNPLAFKVWIHRIGNKELSKMFDFEIYNKKRVCDKHFSNHCRVSYWKKLKWGSLPTLHLPGFQGQSTAINSHIELLSVDKNSPEKMLFLEEPKTEQAEPISDSKSEIPFCQSDDIIDLVDPDDVYEFTGSPESIESNSTQLKIIEDLETIEIKDETTGAEDTAQNVYNQNVLNSINSFDNGKQQTTSEQHSSDLELSVPHLAQASPKASPEPQLRTSLPTSSSTSTATGSYRFKSVKSYISDGTVTEVCRICWRSIVDDNMVRLAEDNPVDVTKRVEDMIKLVLPDLDFNIYPNCCICLRCVSLLTYSAELKGKWKSTENKLQTLKSQKTEAAAEGRAELIILSEGTTKGDHMEDLALADGYKTREDDEHDYFWRQRMRTGSVCTNTLTLGCESNATELENAPVSFQEPPAKPEKIDFWGEGPYLCYVCGAQFISVTRTKRHISQHFKQANKLICDDCGLISKTKTLYDKHKSMHRGLGLRTKNRNIQDKLEAGTSEKVTKQVPGNATTVTNNVDSHSLDGTGDGKFRCKNCNRTFPYLCGLMSHMKTAHLKPMKPTTYTCRHCPKTFTKEVVMKKHMKVHDGCVCPYCDATKKSPEMLQRHIEKMHKNVHEFNCSLCHRPYFDREGLLKHMIIIHGEVPPELKGDTDLSTIINSS